MARTLAHLRGTSVTIHIIKLFAYLQGTFTVSLMFICERQNIFGSFFIQYVRHITPPSFLAGKTDHRSGLRHMLFFLHACVLIFNDCDNFKLHKN